MFSSVRGTLAPHLPQRVCQNNAQREGPGNCGRSRPLSVAYRLFYSSVVVLNLL